ncbi:hypothetical protein N9D31_00475 [Oligoflexaceae bacterium]|nr:hypothetical protein [Oligoflexaceae bacterium]
MWHVAIILLLFSDLAMAGSWSGAGSIFRDEDLRLRAVNTQIGESAAFTGKDTHVSSVFASVGYVEIENKNDSADNILGDILKVEALNYDLKLTQNFGLFRTFSLLAGGSDVKTKLVSEDGGSSSFSYGLEGSQWWAHESLRTTLQVKKNKAKQDAADFTATDGVRILLPAEVESLNALFQVLHIAGKSTIMSYSFSHTQRDDRPDSFGAAIEWRQHFSSAGGSLHSGYSYYENVGQIRPVTTFGEIEAHTLNLSWLQKIGDHTVWTTGYRFYWELESPREADLEVQQIGSDYIFTKFKIRLDKTRWTKDVSSIETMLGVYESNNPSNGWVAGLGFNFLFN